MLTIRKKGKFVVIAVLSIVLLVGGGSAGARYDELIIREKVNIHQAETVVATAPELYRVKEDDSLWLVAQKYGLTVERLKLINGLARENELIKVGQYLRVAGEARIEHVVKRGETLSGIAARYNVKMRDLMAQNGMKNADRLLVGQKLTISGSAGNTLPVFRSGPLPSRKLLEGKLTWPTQGVISSTFGMREGRPHQGIDIAADGGETIRAARQGRVIFAGPRGTYGLAVIIDHGGELETLYAHCSRLLVAAGDRVQTGQPIAKVGSTGRSTGPHLHFEVIWQGVHYDPLLCLDNYYC